MNLRWCRDLAESSLCTSQLTSDQSTGFVQHNHAPYIMVIVSGRVVSKHSTPLFFVVVMLECGAISKGWLTRARIRSRLCNCCRPGHGPCDGSTGPGDCGGQSNDTGLLEQQLGQTQYRAGRGSNSYMSYSSDPNGNWSSPIEIFENYVGSDTNFAPIILPNGSIVAMWRYKHLSSNTAKLAEKMLRI